MGLSVLNWLRKAAVSTSCAHEFVPVAVVQEWNALGEEGTLRPSFQRLACHCRKCPVSTVNVFKTIDGTDPEADPYWYGSIIGGVADYKFSVVEDNPPYPEPTKQEGRQWEEVVEH